MLVLHRGEPFGALFPVLDFAIMHGGLGVTSEALVAGLPVITSGIQLLDQRWWGARMKELGCGSPGVPFGKLMMKGKTGRRRIVELVQEALCVSGEGTWSARAREVRNMLEALREDDSDGVKRNARVVYECGVLDPVAVKRLYAKNRGKRNCLKRQGRCCCHLCESCLSALFLERLFLCFHFWACIFRCSLLRTWRCCCSRRHHRLGCESDGCVGAYHSEDEESGNDSSSEKGSDLEEDGSSVDD